MKGMLWCLGGPDFDSLRRTCVKMRAVVASHRRILPGNGRNTTTPATTTTPVQSGRLEVEQGRNGQKWKGRWSVRDDTSIESPPACSVPYLSFFLSLLL